MCDHQCVLLHDVLYVGGGHTLSGDNAKLFMSETVTKELMWDVCHTPTEHYALTSYHSRLVLVGGLETFTGQPTNILWTLSNNARINWQPSIQMPIECYGASAMNTGTPEYLVVAGGEGVGDDVLDTELNTVVVFSGKEWCPVKPLPSRCSNLKCTLHEGKYYLSGSYHQGNAIYSCDTKSLLKPPVNMRQFSPWSQFQVPLKKSSPASFGQHLISIGGTITSVHSSCPDIVALSPLSQSWVHVGKLPIALDSTASIVLPTGELVVIGGNTGGSYSARVFKATLKGKGDDVY